MSTRPTSPDRHGARFSGVGLYVGANGSGGHPDVTADMDRQERTGTGQPVNVTGFDVKPFGDLLNGQQ